MIQAIAVVPCGVVLLIRCFPLFSAAGAILPLAAFVGGSSAFCLAVCAVASNDARRAIGFASASVLGTMLLGFSTGQSASPAIALGLTAAFVPSATAVLMACETRRHAGRRWSSVARLLLFSGVCGQAWLLGGALEALFAGPGRDALALLLSVLLAACGQYLAAAAAVQSLRLAEGIGDSQPDEAISSIHVTASPAVPQSSAGRLILLTVAAVAAAVLAAILNARAIAAIFSGPTLAYAALGLIPGIGGLAAGTQSARAEWRVFPGESANGLLMRLGHSGFYFDVFLFLFVLFLRIFAPSC